MEDLTKTGTEVADICLYFHINPFRNEIFYVGIGSKKRPYFKRRKNLFWKNIVNKFGYIIDIVHENLTWEEACKLEVFYIKRIGRRDKKLGPLVNLTDGGDGAKGSPGPVGVKRSIEYCIKARERMLGKTPWNKGKEGLYKHSPETIQKLKTCVRSEEFKKNLSLKNKGRKTKPCSEEKKKKLSLLYKGRVWTDEEKEKLKGKRGPQKNKQNKTINNKN